MAAAEELNESEKQQLTELIDGKTYSKQACFFMNAYWTEIKAKSDSTGNDICEEIYQWVHLFEKIDEDVNEKKNVPKGKQGKKLDSHGAARIWEAIGQTLTHMELRAKLKTVDLDADGKMSMIEFLLCKNDADHFDAPCFNFDEMMKRPQGTNAALEEAMAKVQTLLQIGEEADAKEKALIKEIEDYAGKVVKQNRAKNKLSQHRNRDLQPYNRALLTAEAAVRKCKKEKTTSASGTDWFVDRQMAEAAKYKPKGDLARN